MTTRRLPFVLFAIPVCLISVLIIGAQRSHPASAGGVIDPTCTSSLPCIEYDNNGTGPGIRGISVSGNGLAGATKNASTSIANGRAGLIGNDTGTGTFNSGVHGLSVGGTGVLGASTNGVGIQGNSTKNNGVYGVSNAPGASGVFGQNDGGGYGVAARITKPGLAAIFADAGSTGSVAMSASSLNGFGVLATTGSSTQTIFPTVGSAIAGVDLSSGGLGIAVDAVSQQGYALYAANMGATPVLRLFAAGTGRLILADGSHGTVMSLDNDGNMHAHTFTADLAATTGQKVITYAPQASEPTIEDFGEAQLTNGSAYVHLESRFASTMAQDNYLVFITPEGDNRGLYVTQKSANGFAVRESQGGHSTLAFSYRIVAKPFGNQAPRLPLLVEHRVPKLVPRVHN